MAYCGFYNAMAVPSYSIAAFDCDSGVAVGEVDSYGEFRWYGQAQDSSLGRQICKKGRQQPSYKDMYRPPTPPRSRSRSCSRFPDVAGITSSMGGLSVSGCDSRTSRSQSVRSRSSITDNSSRTSRSQSVRRPNMSDNGSRASRSQSVRRPSINDNGSRPSRSQSVRSRAPPRAPSAPPAVRDFKYKPLVSARTTYDDPRRDDGQDRASAAPSRPRSRSRAGPLEDRASAAPSRRRSRSQAGPPPARQLQRAPSQGGSVREVKGARSAGWVRKFVSGI